MRWYFRPFALLAILHLLNVSALAQGFQQLGGCVTLGTTPVCPVATTVTGLTLSGGTLSGTTTLPGSGQIDSNGLIGAGVGTATAWIDAGADRSLSSWTTTGVGLKIRGGTYTDTSGSGTIALRVINSIAGGTLASSSAVTLSNAATLYVPNVPTAGTNTTITKPWATYFALGDSYFGGNIGIQNTNPTAMLTIGKTGAVGTARTYNIFTDSSNGEWAYLGSWGPTANVATYGTDKNGTGATRNVQVMVGGTSKLNYGITTAGVWTTPDPVRLSTGFTVGGLPGAVGAGARAYVTDQLTTCAAAGVALTGGGAVTCPAFFNGTTWVGG